MFGKFNTGARTETIHLRATPDERAKISLAALKTRRTMTNFVLSATLSAADKALGGTGKFDQVESSVEPLPPSANELDVSAAKLINLVAGLTSNLTQLQDHAQRIGGVLTALATEKGPLKKLAIAAVWIGLGAKCGELNGGQAANLVAALTAPALELNQLARSLNEGHLVDARDWHAPVSGLVKVLLTT